MLYYVIVDLKIFFNAYKLPVALCLQIWTSPNFPDPTNFPNSKSFSETCSLKIIDLHVKSV